MNDLKPEFIPVYSLKDIQMFLCETLGISESDFHSDYIEGKRPSFYDTYGYNKDKRPSYHSIFMDILSEEPDSYRVIRYTFERIYDDETRIVETFGEKAEKLFSAIRELEKLVETKYGVFYIHG